MTEIEFDNFIRKSGADILRFCRLLDGVEGDELYQETLLILWEKRDRLRVDENVKSYALSVAIRLHGNIIRKLARRRRIVPEVSYDAMLEEGRAPDPSTGDSENPERQALEAERNAYVRKAVDGLSEKHRRTIYLYYGAELTIKEISECLHIPESTVKTRLRSARNILKDKLEKVIT